MQVNNFSSEFTLNCNGKLLHLTAPKVMGILNITPDSFFDGGKFTEEKQIINRVNKMVEDGAAIVDVGAVSTRPNAKNVSQKTELQRLVPVLKMLVAEFPETIFSVDTFRAAVAVKAVESGAAIINDVSGGNFDKKMFATVAELKVPYILMHMQGNPQTMQKNPLYKNVVKEVLYFFQHKISVLKKLGVNDIILDPGFGFGKTTDHNYELLRHFELFGMLHCPLMAGMSRKSMINKVLKTNPEKALNGTTVINTIALLNGAKILRVHDVKEARETIELVNFYQANL